MDGDRTKFELAGLRGAFARSPDPYAGADIALARRFATVTWSLGTAVTFILIAFFPPTHALGQAGWLVLLPAILATAAGGAYVRRHPERVTYNVLFWAGWLGLAQLTLLQWLGGGRPAPFHELFLFQIIGTALLHPARRFTAFVCGVFAAGLAPYFYARPTAPLGEILTEQFLWLALGIFLLVLMRSIRAQRVQLREEGDRAQRLARIDPLTGLGNRRAFDEALDGHLASRVRTTGGVSILVADLNGFKHINDEYGHLAGDDCLRQVAHALRGALREGDGCFRWGGDEFAMLSSDANAAAVAARLEAAVRDGCHGPDGTPLTVACGHAEIAGRVTAAEAVSAADAVLLALKRREPASAR